MKRVFKTIVILSMIILTTSVVSAQEKKKSSSPKIGVELGAVGGISIPSFSCSGSGATFSANLGYTLGLHFGLNIGRYFSIQPELMFLRTGISVKDPGHSFSSTIKSNALQLPLLFTGKISVVRISAGPLFTLIDSPTFNCGGEKTMFGRIYPTVGYCVGAGVCIRKHWNLDVRYLGLFKKMNNNYAWNPQMECVDVKSKVGALQIRVGYYF